MSDSEVVELEEECPVPQATDYAKEIEALKDTVLRLRAENENLFRRSEKDKTDIAKFSIFKFAQDALPVADNLERALCSIHQSVDQQTIIKGIELVQKEFMSFLEKNEITKFDSLHQPFDPMRHEAILEVEEGDQPSNSVVQVMQEGYLIYNRLLRPAMVGIKK